MDHQSDQVTMPVSYELDWLKQWNLYAPGAVAIQDADTGEAYTYRRFYHAAGAGAGYLSRLGVRRGDRVAVLATNELDYVVLFFAIQRLGAILVPINFRLTQREVDHIVADCDPRVIVHQEAYGGMIREIPEAEQRRTVLLSEFSKHVRRADDASAAAHDFAGRPEDPCMILYTSGTTGAPKGAIITHSMIFWNSINTTLRLNLTQDDCTVTFLPFFHTGGWNVLTTPLLHRGGRVVFMKKFDADRILRLCDSEKATILFGVPTTMDMMRRCPSFDQVGLKSLRYAIVGGEAMPIELIQVWHEKGIPIRQGYGLTEFGPSVFSLSEKDAMRKIGSIGFPNFYAHAKIMADDWREAAPGDVGELWLKGPMCMLGYWKNPKATEETITDGWLRTGDLVRKDEEGYYYVVGRKKDMYKSGGENVYPAELEKVLRTLPGIREAAVIGVGDVKWGEVGRAFMVREPGSDLREDQVLDHCARNLAKFKIPKYFRFVDDLPKSDSGKILKRRLQEIFPEV